MLPVLRLVKRMIIPFWCRKSGESPAFCSVRYTSLLTDAMCSVDNRNNKRANVVFLLFR